MSSKDVNESTNYVHSTEVTPYEHFVVTWWAWFTVSCTKALRLRFEIPKIPIKCSVLHDWPGWFTTIVLCIIPTVLANISVVQSSWSFSVFVCIREYWTYRVFNGGQLLAGHVCGVLLAIGTSEILALDVRKVLTDCGRELEITCIGLPHWGAHTPIRMEHEDNWNSGGVCCVYSLMQCMDGVSSSRFRHTVQKRRLWCVGSDQQCATGFLMMHGAMPVQGVTTFDTQRSCTMKLHTVCVCENTRG